MLQKYTSSISAEKQLDCDIYLRHAQSPWSLLWETLSAKTQGSPLDPTLLETSPRPRTQKQKQKSVFIVRGRTRTCWCVCTFKELDIERLLLTAFSPKAAKHLAKEIDDNYSEE